MLNSLALMHRFFATTFSQMTRALATLSLTIFSLSLFAAGPLTEEDNPFSLGRLREEHREGDKAGYYLEGLEAAAFRRTEVAAKAFGRFLDLEKKDLNKRHTALSTLASCYLREGEYGKAALLFRQALAEGATVLSPEDKSSTEQCVSVAQALSGCPAQVTLHRESSALRFTRDKVNLANLEIRINGSKTTAIWDTGANFCMAAESFAKSMGLEFLKGEVEISTSTGKPVRGRMALARELEIGACRLQQVAFVVLPDEALTFPQAQYAIHAVLGFPVLDALGTVRFEPGDRVCVGLPDLPGERPMLALSGNTPLLAVGYRGAILPFLLDSGSRRSSVREAFVARFKETGQGAKEENVIRGGAGGVIKTTELVLPSLVLDIAGGKAALENVNVEDEAKSSVSQCYGTIGSDLLYAGDGYEINFRSLQFRLLPKSAKK